MSSICTSLHTDRSSEERVELDFSELSYSLVNHEFNIPPDKSMENQTDSFPSVNFSLNSSKTSEQLSAIKEKNNLIKAAIIFEVSKLKVTSEQLANAEKSTQPLQLMPHSQSVVRTNKYTELTTNETDENIATLQEIIGHLKYLNKTLEKNKKKLIIEKNRITELSNEQTLLLEHLESISPKNKSEFHIDTTENHERLLKCRCWSF